MKKINLLVIAILFATNIFAQNVGIDESNFEPNTNAILELKSNLKGFLPPRLTSADRDNLTSSLTPAEEGLQIYNKDKGNMETWNGTRWVGTVPVGTIQPFAGDVDDIPKGWTLCDGKPIDVGTNKEYADLGKVLNGFWANTNAYNFKVPDLRGIFLRGVNGDRTGNFADPDKASRTNAEGTPIGSILGSYQGDEFESHNHGGGSHSHSLPYQVWVNANVTASAGGCGDWITADASGCYMRSRNLGTNSSGTIISSEGGSTETRPKNAYVNYIIKY